MPHSQSVEVFEDGALAVNGRGQNVSAEQAYSVYTAARSLRRTADLLNLPHGTVLSWSQRYGWSQRMHDTDLERVEGAVEGMVVAVVGQVYKTIETLAAIRDNEEASAMARVKASDSLLREYGNVVRSFGNSILNSERASLEAQADDELEELVQTPEGVQVLLDRHRKRTGRA